jgi:hypothetical protein
MPRLPSVIPGVNYRDPSVVIPASPPRLRLLRRLLAFISFLNPGDSDAVPQSQSQSTRVSSREREAAPAPDPVGRHPAPQAPPAATPPVNGARRWRWSSRSWNEGQGEQAQDQERTPPSRAAATEGTSSNGFSINR